MIEFRDHEYLKVDDVKDILNKHPSVIRKYCRKGLIPGAKKILKEWIIPPEGITSFLSGESLPSKNSKKKREVSNGSN